MLTRLKGFLARRRELKELDVSVVSRPRPAPAELVQVGVVRRNPRNFRQPSSSPATSASRSMNLPSVWKV